MTEKPIVAKEIRRPIHHSEFTASHMLDGQTRFNPDGPVIYDRHGKRLNHFDTLSSPAPLPSQDS